MGRVVHFEIQAEDPERAVRFYSDLLGWSFTKWSGPAEYWLIKTGDEAQRGIDGGLLRRNGAFPQPGQSVNSYVCTAEVEGIDAHIAKATSLDAEIAVPKMPIPGVGWLVYMKDTEGNIFGMMETDPTAGSTK